MSMNKEQMAPLGPPQSGARQAWGARPLNGRSYLLTTVGAVVSALVGAGTLHSAYILPSVTASVSKELQEQIKTHERLPQHHNAVSRHEFDIFRDQMLTVRAEIREHIVRIDARHERILDLLEKLKDARKQ